MDQFDRTDLGIIASLATTEWVRMREAARNGGLRFEHASQAFTVEQCEAAARYYQKLAARADAMRTDLIK